MSVVDDALAWADAHLGETFAFGAREVVLLEVDEEGRVVVEDENETKIAVDAVVAYRRWGGVDGGNDS